MRGVEMRTTVDPSRSFEPMIRVRSGGDRGTNLSAGDTLPRRSLVALGLALVVLLGAVLVVPAEPAAAAPRAAAAAPALGPIGPVTDPIAPGTARGPVSAFDGTNHLVVWGESGELGGWRIGGTMVAPDGTVLDPTGFTVAEGPNDYVSAVAYDGTNYLVVFHRLIDDGRFQPDIYGVRVSPDGIVLGAAFPVTDRPTGQWSPVVAFDGTNFLVAWTESGPEGGDAYAARVTPAGTVLDPAGLPVAVLDGGQNVQGIAFDGTDFLVVWSDTVGDGNIVAARVTPAGTVLDPAGIVVATGVGALNDASVAAVGPNVMIVWVVVGDEGASLVLGGRVAPSGAVLDGNGFVIDDTTSQAYEPTVAFDGSNAQVVWGDGVDADLLGARVTPAAVVLDPVAVAMAAGDADHYSPSLSSDGDGFLLAWTHLASSVQDVRGTEVGGDGRPMRPDGADVSTAPSADASDIASDHGTTHLVVWTTTTRGGGPRRLVYAARVGLDGVRLDGAGILVSATAAPSAPDVTVTYDGTNFLVAWSDIRTNHQDVYGARISRDGVLLDPDGFAISRAHGEQSDPVASFDGTNSLVVWEDHRAPRNTNLWATRVEPDGSVQDEFAISRRQGAQTAPDVAFDGFGSLVVWQDARFGGSDIFSTRVGATGGPISPWGIRVSTAPGDQTEPAVAWNGGRHLVVWSDRRSGGSDIYGARVTIANRVQDLDGLAVSTAAGDQSQPVVTANWPVLLVAWTDRRSGGAADVYGGRVDWAGVARDGNGFAIASTSDDERRPALANGPGISQTAVWTRGRPADPTEEGILQTRRVARR
jgi:hypothetical protein